MTKYDSKYTCPKCKSVNDIKVVASIDGVTITECKTKCTKCNYVNYWAFGYYEPKEDPTENYFNNIFKKRLTDQN